MRAAVGAGGQVQPDPNLGQDRRPEGSCVALQEEASLGHLSLKTGKAGLSEGGLTGSGGRSCPRPTPITINLPERCSVRRPNCLVRPNWNWEGEINRGQNVCQGTEPGQNL